ncbi:MAG: M23 family metallopeptidase [Acidobacteriia bacterium]|nr:M23 family metallopeptidase [Terriglobia bacterium]
MKTLLVVVFVLLLLCAAPLIYLVSSNETVLKLENPPKVIAFQTPVTVRAENSHGVRWVTLAITQDGKTTETRIAQAKEQSIFPKRNEAPVIIRANVGKQSTPSLHDGKAKITITAVSNDFRGKSTSVSLDVDVMTEPPRVSADGAQHYINQGGSEMVTFTPGGAWTEAGVQVGDYKFRSFPLPNHPGQYFSLFAYSWQNGPETPAFVYASNPAGTLARADFTHKVFPKKFRASTIPLEVMNLDRIVGQIDPNNQIKGDLVERFIYINNEMRKQNNKVLADLRLQSEQKFLWFGAFLPMVDSTVESRFADDRTYTWQGKKVDQQTHLGFDLAKLAHSPVPASNDGRVIFAENLGIYGNCIVVDHGFGLQTVYAHLSEFLVKQGDMVTKGQTLGKTGATGLAGGDHLHFTMLIDGVQVNPVEWWDAHWLKDRILSRMDVTLDEKTPSGGYPAPKSRATKTKKSKRR